MLRKRGIPHQNFSVPERWNPITNDLDSLGRYHGPNRVAHLAQNSASRLRNPGQILIHALRRCSALTLGRTTLPAGTNACPATLPRPALALSAARTVT